MLRVCLAATLLLWMTAAGAAPRPYELQQDESRVGFSWFLGRDEIKGRMPVKSADIAIDFDRVENSRVRVTLDVAKAQAGFPFASQGMKSPSVLWAAKYPEIRFTSTRFERDGPGAKVTGDLTVRGVTRPVVLDARLFRPIGNQTRRSAPGVDPFGREPVAKGFRGGWMGRPGG